MAIPPVNWILNLSQEYSLERVRNLSGEQGGSRRSWPRQLFGFIRNWARPPCSVRVYSDQNTGLDGRALCHYHQLTRGIMVLASQFQSEYLKKHSQLPDLTMPELQ